MRTKLTTALVAGVVALVAAAPAFAAGQPRQPGVPGDANCERRTVAYFAQLAKATGDEFQRLRGIGQLVNNNDTTVTVQQFQENARLYLRRARVAKGLAAVDERAARSPAATACRRSPPSSGGLRCRRTG